MSSRIIATALGAMLGAVGPAVSAQQPPPPATEVGATQLALANNMPRTGARLSVTSPSFAQGGDIPFENTQYRGNVFPGLTWSEGPAGTKAYVLIMQDGDALRNGAPILHWTMVNIPVNVRKLDSALSAPPAGAQYGPNIRGANQPYMGPRTPAGPKHRYHFQIFALDVTIPQESTATYDALMTAMKDHVMASGEVVGLGQIAPAPKEP